MFKSLFLLCIFNWLCINESAKILGIFPNAGYSQYILGSTLMKALAAKGHEVTVISPFAQKITIRNYKDVKAEYVNKLKDSENLFGLESMSAFQNIMAIYDELSLPLTEHLLNDSKVQELLHSNATFDLVICELFVNEAHMGFAHHYKAPLVIFSSIGSSEWSNHLVANPAPFSYVPIIFTSLTDRMDFWQRLENTIIGLFDIIYKHAFVYPKQNDILKKYFPNAPDLKELMYNSSMILLNSHVAMNFPVPHVPSMIEIGGFHVSPKQLRKDLQNFLDEAHDGAIYFSMGSNLKSKDLPNKTIDSILKVFSKLKQRILWKWEDEFLQGKPENVKIGKWMPQQDILVHPNIRVFISHSGLLSTTEAIYNGIPMICIPIFGDQKMNTEMAISNGFAIKIPFTELSDEKLAWALNEILTNASYRETAQRRSKILKDQPTNSLDKAIYWIEYVIRHNGAPHLKSAALDLYWYQYLLLDVFGFILIVAAFVIIFCVVCIRLLFKSLLRKRNNKEKQL